MTAIDRVELFLLKCAVIQRNLEITSGHFTDFSGDSGEIRIDSTLDVFIKQFELDNRQNAARMAEYYKIFYMLENDMHRLIAETLETAHGSDWWDKHVPEAVKVEVKKNINREAHAGVSIRSDADIDYTTFGQLGDIIRENWADFAGMLSNQSAVTRVFSALNMLRGTIAHCGLLAEDEVDRLKLAIKDWFRVLEGPRA